MLLTKVTSVRWPEQLPEPAVEGRGWMRVIMALCDGKNETRTRVEGIN